MHFLQSLVSICKVRIWLVLGNLSFAQICWLTQKDRPCPAHLRVPASRSGVAQQADTFLLLDPLATSFQGGRCKGARSRAVFFVASPNSHNSIAVQLRERVFFTAFLFPKIDQRRQGAESQPLVFLDLPRPAEMFLAWSVSRAFFTASAHRP